MESGTKKRQNGGNSASSVNGSRSSSREVKTENSVRTSSATSLSNSQSTMKSQNLLADPSSITGYDLRAHLRQILTFSDDEDFASSDEDCSLNSFEESFEVDESVDAELQKLVGGPPGQDQPPTPKPTTGDNNAALKAIAEEDDLSSEEENEIMREIKNEITNNVRGEMKSELDLYKYKMEKLEREAGGEAGTSEGQKKGAIYEGLDDLEPKLREAIIKMRKLDKILTKRVRREKEVKRDRILLERRIRREIEALNSEKPDEYKEVRANEQKFLSLELPSRHNEGVTIPDEFTGEEVFATQLNEEEYPGLHSHRSTSQGKHHSDRSRKSEKGSSKAGSIGGGESESQADSESVTSGSRAGESRRKHKQRGKDFIKRNKELAADAQNLIAMTEEEKKRLEELLADVDTLADVPDQPGDLDEDNPFQIAIKPGEGFHPDADESRSLTSIDNQLRELLPPEEFESIASSSVLSFAPKVESYLGRRFRKK